MPYKQLFFRSEAREKIVRGAAALADAGAVAETAANATNVAKKTPAMTAKFRTLANIENLVNFMR